MKNRKKLCPLRPATRAGQKARAIQMTMNGIDASHQPDNEATSISTSVLSVSGSYAGTSVGEVGARDSPADRPARDAARFDVAVLLVALGAFGFLLFWVYRTFARVRKDADDVGRVFGLLATPRRKSRRPRFVGKR